MKTDLDWMKRALEIAGQAGDDCPIGSIVVRNGEELAARHNEVELQSNPVAHCEMLAIQHACASLGTRYLTDCTIYCTLEPCPMCMEAIRLAQVQRLIFGAFRDINHPYTCDTVGGIMSDECGQLLTEFFRKRR